MQLQEQLVAHRSEQYHQDDTKPKYTGLSLVPHRTELPFLRVPLAEEGFSHREYAYIALHH